MYTVTIKLSNDELSLLLRVLGKEKKWLNDGGFFASAHLISDLQSKIKNEHK
jgi:hypothetical protein